MQLAGFSAVGQSSEPRRNVIRAPFLVPLPYVIYADSGYPESHRLPLPTLHVAPCFTRITSISASPNFRAQAKGVAHGSSSGRLVAAPRLSRNSTIRRPRYASLGSLLPSPERTAAANGISLNSRPRALMSAPASRRTAATDRSPLAAQACRNVLPSQSGRLGSSSRANSLRTSVADLGQVRSSRENAMLCLLCVPPG
jgi:hypothetical protein